MKTLRRIAILFFGVVFAISLFMLARILVQGRQEQAAFDRLSAALGQPKSADGLNPEQSPYEALKAQNPDFFGWISIEGTNIDYPVMFTPDDPEHYLRRAFDGSSSQSGCALSLCRLFCRWRQLAHLWPQHEERLHVCGSAQLCQGRFLAGASPHSV